MKRFCLVAEFGGGGYAGSLCLFWFLLDCVQLGIRARSGNRKARDISQEVAALQHSWLDNS